MRAWHLRWFIPLNLMGLMLLIGWWAVTNSPLQKLRAAGQATTFDELLGPLPLDETQNTAAGLRDALALLQSDSKSIGELNDLLAFSSDPAEHLDATRALLSQHDLTLDRIDAALERPDYRTLLSAEDLNEAEMAGVLHQTENARAMARFLNLASLTAIYGDGTAVEAVSRQLRHAKAIEGEPVFTQRMVACAVQGMALETAGKLVGRARLSRDDAASLDALIAAVEDRSALEWALKSERVFAISRSNSLPAVVGIWESPSVLRLWQRAIGEVNAPLDELAAAGKRVATTASGSLASLTAPAIQAIFEAEARVGLQARQLRATLKANQANR